MSIKDRFDLAEFYRRRLRPIPFVRVPKETVWAFAVFIKWKVLRPFLRACVPRRLLYQLHIVKGRADAYGMSVKGRADAYGMSFIAYLMTRAPKLPLRAFAAVKASSLDAVSHQIFPEGNVECAMPKIFPSDLAGVVPPISAAYYFPPVTVTELFNVEVAALSNLLVLDQSIVHHDLYRFSHDFMSEELHGKISIDVREASVKRYIVPPKEQHFEVAAAFTDACAPNYAHWLTEVLPRIFAYSKAGLSRGVPILLDAGLHPNLRASASLVSRAGTLISQLEPGTAATVRRLHVVSPAGYIPFERRPGPKVGHSHGVFSPHVLLAMREHLAAVLERPTQKLPKKILLRRSSAARAMKNEQELEDRLVPLGFEPVYPERLTFEAQYHTFSRAQVIVGATGAAFANIVFSPPSTHVVICISAHPEHSFGYWPSMAAAVGNAITYVLGPVQGPRAQGLHASFSVNVDDVIEAVNADPRRGFNDKD
jgi:capsular polysaccharide biosynthesis protein